MHLEQCNEDQSKYNKSSVQLNTFGKQFFESLKKITRLILVKLTLEVISNINKTLRGTKNVLRKNVGERIPLSLLTC